MKYYVDSKILESDKPLNLGEIFNKLELGSNVLGAEVEGEVKDFYFNPADESKIDVQIITPNPLTYFHFIEASKCISFSKIHNNSSIYDPFWHVAPIPIVFCIASQSSLSNLQQGLVLSAFLFWALRLTYNWFLNWTNLDHEDFRYIDLKDTNKLLAFVNDFFGIHLIPTLIVNVSLYPIYIALNSELLNNLVYVGFILSLIHISEPTRPY